MVGEFVTCDVGGVVGKGLQAGALESMLRVCKCVCLMCLVCVCVSKQLAYALTRKLMPPENLHIGLKLLMEEVQRDSRHRIRASRRAKQRKSDLYGKRMHLDTKKRAPLLQATSDRYTRAVHMGQPGSPKITLRPHLSSTSCMVWPTPAPALGECMRTDWMLREGHTTSIDPVGVGHAVLKEERDLLARDRALAYVAGSAEMDVMSWT